MVSLYFLYMWDRYYYYISYIPGTGSDQIRDVEIRSEMQSGADALSISNTITPCDQHPRDEGITYEIIIDIDGQSSRRWIITKKEKKIEINGWFVHIQTKQGQENLLRMMRWIRWHALQTQDAELEPCLLWVRVRCLTVAEYCCEADHIISNGWHQITWINLIRDVECSAARCTQHFPVIPVISIYTCYNRVSLSQVNIPFFAQNTDHLMGLQIKRFSSYLDILN